MKKIPVLATIREAYGFTFNHLGAIIGLIWLPMIILTVIGFFVLQRYFDAYAGALASGNYAAMGPEALGLFCYVAAALLLLTMMAVPVTQLALGIRKAGALVHFAFGPTEWRLLRGVLGLVGFLVLPLILVSIVAAFLGAQATEERMMAAVGGLYLLYLAGTIFFGLRFGLVMPALAVSENNPLLTRAWTLTAGNFWRLLLVALALFIPVEALSILIQLAVQGPAAFRSTGELSTAMAAAQAHAMAMNMPLTSGISFLVAPLVLGLVLGAGASVYRALSDNGRVTIIPPGA